MIKLSKIKIFLIASLAQILVFSSGCAEDILVQLSTRTDEFVQQAAAEIDILWVVDNSNSMAANQQGLGQSFQSFIDNLVETGVDYHIGVVSTDTAEGGRLSGSGVIDGTVESPQSSFLSNVQVGTWGSPIERAFESAALALGVGPGWNPGDAPNPPNNGFIRDTASLFIIMVSDEDDKSFGPVGYYRRLFEHYKGPGNESLISVSAIVGDPGEGCFEPTRGSAQPGTRYIDLASQTGGLYTSICDDFAESLKELSINASGLNSQFELSQAPNTRATIRCSGVEASSFCVVVDGQPIPEGTRSGRVGWRYSANTNSIVFLADSIPGPQSKITVEYQGYR